MAVAASIVGVATTAVGVVVESNLRRLRVGVGELVLTEEQE
jgi:hypothetical protein